MNKRGQVWVETVLYTLIGLALIGLALGFIMPKINESKDRIFVEQTINSLGTFDNKIMEVVQYGVGNVRQIELSMKRGELYINTKDDKIEFVLTGLKKPFSQLNENILMGRVNVISYKGTKDYSVNLTTSYPNMMADIKYNGINRDIAEKFPPVAIPYKFSIANEVIENAKFIINIQLLNLK